MFSFGVRGIGLGAKPRLIISALIFIVEQEETLLAVLLLNDVNCVISEPEERLFV